MVVNISPADSPPPPATLGVESEGQNSTFSKHGHASYQIKGKHECSNLEANIFPAAAPLYGDAPYFPCRPHGSEYFARRSPSPPPNHRGGVRRSNFNFFRTWSCCISHLMESRMQQHGSKYIFVFKKNIIFLM